jgi:hypothetical protein
LIQIRNRLGMAIIAELATSLDEIRRRVGHSLNLHAPAALEKWRGMLWRRLIRFAD